MLNNKKTNRRSKTQKKLIDADLFRVNGNDAGKRINDERF